MSRYPYQEHNAILHSRRFPLTVGFSLVHSHVLSGTGVYTRQLIQALQKHYTQRIHPVYLGEPLIRVPPGSNYVLLPQGLLRYPFQWGINQILKNRIKDLDLLHYPTGVGPLISSKPLVVTIHDLSPWDVPETMQPVRRMYLQYVFKRVIELSRIVILDSVFQQNRFACLFPQQLHKVRVLPLFLDNFPEQNTTQAGIPEDLGTYLLMVGNIEPRKNILRVFKAWESLKENINLVLVGKWGWKIGDVKAFLSHSETHKFTTPNREEWTFSGNRKIIMLKNVALFQLTIIYQRALCLLYPSLYEGFGLPVLEAMGNGCPVVTSVDSSMTEIAREAAVYCDPLDQNSILEAIRKVIDSQGFRSALIEEGKNRAALFTPDQYVESLVSCYEEAVSG